MIVRTGTAVCHCNMLRGLPATSSGPAWNTLRASPATGALVRQKTSGEWAHFFLPPTGRIRGGQSLRWRRLSRRGHLSGRRSIRTPLRPYVFQHEVEAVSPL